MWKIKKILPKDRIYEVEFHEAKMEKVPKLTYFFDCMLVPFGMSLNEFKEKVPQEYEQYQKVIRGIQNVVRLLLDHNYSIWISIACVEGNFPDLEKRIKLTFEELNDDCELVDYTVYEIEK